jgi:hypothetical protein
MSSSAVEARRKILVRQARLSRNRQGSHPELRPTEPQWGAPSAVWLAATATHHRSDHVILARQARLTLIAALACAVSPRRSAETGCAHRHQIARDQYSSMMGVCFNGCRRATRAGLAWRAASHTPAGIRCRHKSADDRLACTPERVQSHRRSHSGRPRSSGDRDYLPLMASAREGL